MKKYIQILLVVFITGLLFVSCESDKPELKYTGDNFIAFSKTTFSMDESFKGQVEVVVFMAAPKQGSAVTVNVDITSPDNSAVEGTHYNLIYPTDGKLTFAAGTFYDTIVVEIIDNTLEDGDKTIGMAITSNSAGMTLGYPGPDAISKTAKLVITDNDCAFIPINFTGKVSGVEFYPNGEYTTDAVFKLKDDTDPLKPVYSIEGIMQSIYAGWGETVDAAGSGLSNGNVAEVTFDYTDAFNPAIILTEQNLSTTDGGAWIYDIKEDPAKTSSFLTCGSKIWFYYMINVSEPGTDYGARSCYIIGEFAE